MLASIIPAFNESSSITAVITSLLCLPIDVIIPVINGCSDNTLTKILQLPQTRIKPILFPFPLGIDIPRAIGALYGYSLGASQFLFVDGDMTGPLSLPLTELINYSLKAKLDVALSDCYPGGHGQEFVNEHILSLRKELNQELHYQHLGLATPAHGPHILSRKVIATIPIQSLAVPPLSIVYCQKNSFKIGIGTNIPHSQLGSANRGPLHDQLISETLIGDLLQALSQAKGFPPSRIKDGHEYIGYHNQRRFDQIKKGLGSKYP